MNITSWIFNAIMTCVLWGLWGFFGKLASRSITAQNLIVISTIGWVITLPVFYLMYRKYFLVDWHSMDFYYGLLSGVFGSIGGLFFFFALSRGEASRVVAITAAYPLVAALLAFLFLREPVTAAKALGLLFTLVGIYILST